MEILRSGKRVELVGNPPEVGDFLPKFKVFDADGQKIKTRDLIGKPLLISVVPDLNTKVCKIQTKKFNQKADDYPEIKFVTISNNTIDDQADWCAAEGVHNLSVLSDHELSFGYEMKLYIPNADYLARSIFIMDAEGKIIYREIVPELHDEPDYAAALSFIEQM